MKALSRPMRMGIFGLALVSALQVFPEATKGLRGLHLLSKVMFIVAGFWALDRLAKFFLIFRRENLGLTPSSQTLVLTMIRVLIFGSAVLIILDTAGISSLLCWLRWALVLSPWLLRCKTLWNSFFWDLFADR